MFHSGRFGVKHKHSLLKYGIFSVAAVCNRVSGSLQLLDGRNRQTDGIADYVYLSTFDTCMK